MSHTKIKRAWLLTWEHATHRSARFKRFVAVISSRYGDAQVRKIVEQYYVSNYLSIPEQFSYLQTKASPYCVQHCTVAVSESLQQAASLSAHVPFSDSMIIGGNPWLWHASSMISKLGLTKVARNI